MSYEIKPVCGVILIIIGLIMLLTKANALGTWLAIIAGVYFIIYGLVKLIINGLQPEE